eukprot:365777-Chlamydomonas_euryale.AAC.1
MKKMCAEQMLSPAGTHNKQVKNSKGMEPLRTWPQNGVQGFRRGREPSAPPRVLQQPSIRSIYDHTEVTRTRGEALTHGSRLLRGKSPKDSPKSQQRSVDGREAKLRAFVGRGTVVCGQRVWA